MSHSTHKMCTYFKVYLFFFTCESSLLSSQVPDRSLMWTSYFVPGAGEVMSSERQQAGEESALDEPGLDPLSKWKALQGKEQTALGGLIFSLCLPDPSI